MCMNAEAEFLEFKHVSVPRIKSFVFNNNNICLGTLFNKSAISLKYFAASVLISNPCTKELDFKK